MAPRTSRTAVWVSALAIAAFQLVGTFGASDDQPGARAVDAAAVALVLLGPAALAVRDRWPLAAVVVATVAADLYVARGYAYGPIFVSVVVALFTAVRAGRRRATWALAAAGFAGYAVAAAVRDDGGGALHLAAVAGWLVVVLAVSEVVRGRLASEAARERAAEEERQRLAGEQRLRLAQELHDVLAHNISLINVQAGVALHLIDDQPERAGPALANIKEASREALHELRSALDLLRSGEQAPLAPAPGLGDLADLIDGVRAGGLDVHLEHGAPPGPLPAAVELAAYRIVQEALTNVTRHARARTVRVRVHHGDAGTTVEVVDDGVGGPVRPGNGIVGMRERAAALGGTVEAGPRPGGGFGVLAHLPGSDR
jgi:signal transduction histidine kinase